MHRQKVVTFLFLSLSKFSARSHVLHFIKTSENCSYAPRLAKKCAIWISSPESLSEKNWRCSVLFFKAQKKLQNHSSVKQKKIMKDG